MIYIDSDDTISGFIKWCLSKDKDCLKHLDQDSIGKIMYDYRDECFLKQEVKPGAGFFLELLKTRDDCKVLTALSSEKKMSKFCKDISYQELIKIHSENKYKWFENHGIPRSKVIILKPGEKKSKYCEPGDILFDDQDKNIIDWEEHEGIAIKIDSEFEKYFKNK